MVLGQLRTRLLWHSEQLLGLVASSPAGRLFLHRPSWSSSTFPRGSHRTHLPRSVGSIEKALPLDSMEHTQPSPAVGDETKSEFPSLLVISSSVHFYFLTAAPALLFQSCISISQTFEVLVLPDSLYSSQSPQCLKFSLYQEAFLLLRLSIWNGIIGRWQEEKDVSSAEEDWMRSYAAACRNCRIEE